VSDCLLFVSVRSCRKETSLCAWRGTYHDSQKNV